MQVLKPRSLVARLVTAGAAGFCIAIGLFAILFHVIDVPFKPGPVAKPFRAEFTRVLVATPTQIIDIAKPKPMLPEPTDLPTPKDFTDPQDPIDRPIDRSDGPDTWQFNPNSFGTRPGTGTRVTFTGGSDQEATRVVGIPPQYPARALIQGTEGWVRVRFTITPTGSVRDAAVVSAQPRGVFDEAALTAIARWRYAPRILDGVAVERVGVETLIEFQLTD